MKGPSSTGLRARVTAAFALAFIGGAVAIFGISSIAGAAFAAFGVPAKWRIGAAAVSLIGLAIVDVLSIRTRNYCLIGPRRQTPQLFHYRSTRVIAAAVWGFDTGLAVTTFRVAAVTWAALVFALLGFSSWLSGVVYGVAFVLPLLVLVSMETSSAKLEALLRRRSAVQGMSAIVLLAAGAVVISGS